MSFYIKSLFYAIPVFMVLIALEAVVANKITVNKEGFKWTIKAGSGRLAAEAKRKEYQRLMAKRKPPPAEADGGANFFFANPY